MVSNTYRRVGHDREGIACYRRLKPDTVPDNEFVGASPSSDFSDRQRQRATDARVGIDHDALTRSRELCRGGRERPGFPRPWDAPIKLYELPRPD